MPSLCLRFSNFTFAGRVGIALLLAAHWSLSSCALLPGYTPSAVLAAENLAVADGYAELSKFSKAQEYYRKAARSKAYRNAAEWGLARSLALSGDFASALPVLEGLLERDGKNRMLLEARAYALVMLSRADDGLAAYDKLRSDFPDDPEAAADYVAALVLAERWDEALEESERVRERFPDSDALSRLDKLDETAVGGKDKEAAADTRDESASEGDPVPSGDTPPD